VNTATKPRVTTDIEPISRKNCTPAAITQGWQRTAGRFTQSRGRGLACHNLRHNLDVASIPETWGTQEDRDQIAASIPERQLIEQGIVNDLSEFWPVYRRQAIGSPTPTKNRQAGNLERWLEGCDDEQMDQETIWAKAAEDGEFAYVLMPDVADFHYVPSYSDEITDKEFKALRKEAQAGWRYARDDGKWTRPKKSYWRDDKRKPADKPKEMSERNTTEAYSKEINTMGKRLPWVERLISMYDCAPVLTRGRGKQRYQVSGLYVRTLYDVDELQQDGWQWIGMENRELIPRGFSRSNTTGAAGSLYLYEYYFYDYEEQDGKRIPIPCVAYCVAGQGTAKSDHVADPEQCYVIDLRDAFGLDELPVGYFWGMRTAADDPDYIGRPLLWPLVATITNLEKIVTAKNAFDWDNGFAGYVMPVDPGLDPLVQAAAVENGTFKAVDRPEPGEVVYSTGAPIPFTGAQAGPGINEGIAFHSDRLRMNQPEETPGQRATGASGHSQLVAEDLKQQAHRQLKECVRQVKEFAGNQRIKFGCAFDAKFGVQIPVEANLEHDADSSPGDGEARGLMEFDTRWVGDVYKITAEFPKVGNLAEAQQYADFKERGLVLWEEFREKLGDENPANSKVKRDVEAYYESPPAMIRMDAAVAAMLNDQEEKDRLDAELAGLLTPEGVPPGAIAPDAAAGAQMPGMAMPNIPGSVLGAEVAGAVGQASQMADAQSMAAVPGGF
jgi:hypothetical protein